MEPPKKILWFLLKLTKRLKFYKLGIIYGILHLDYLKMRVRKVNTIQDIALKNFNSIENISFYLQKFNISLML